MKTIKVAKNQSFRSLLIALHACSGPDSAMAWIGHKSLRCAYRTCQRGDWMLWLAGKSAIDRKMLVRAACDCARLAWELQDTAGHAAIETAEAWCHGEATIEQVRAAAYAAYSAYSADADAAAYYSAAAAYAAAAYSAADAAAAAAGYAAYAAAGYAASAAGYAAYSDAASAHRVTSRTLEKCADLVRARIPLSALEEAIRRLP